MPWTRLLHRPHLLLLVMVGFAASVRSVVAWRQPTPVFFPDEIIYSSLARGIAETARPVLLGESLHFPALLTSYVTSPFWLFENTALAYRLVQSIGVLSFCLAAIPVYALARRLSLPTTTGLVLAGGVLVLPDLALASLLLSEPFAFLLFSLTVLAAHQALTSVQNTGDQLLFIGLLALLCLTRTQFIYFPAAYLVALVSQGLLERQLRQRLRDQFLVLAAFAIPVLATIVVGFESIFGFYSSIVGYLTPEPTVFVDWVLANLLVLTLSGGWILVPGALLGWLAVTRAPNNAAERSFALLCIPIFVLQLAQAASISTQVKDAQGRYLIYLLPLLLTFFALAERRGLLTRWPYALGLLGLIPIALTAGIFELNRASINSAPILLSRYALENTVGVPDTYASIPFALAALSVVGLLAWWQRSVAVLAGVVAAYFLATSVGGNWGQLLLGNENVTAAHRSFLAEENIEQAVLLVDSSSEGKFTMGMFFWNPQIVGLASLDGRRVSVLPVDLAGLAPDGTLLVNGKAYTGDLVVDRSALRATVRGAPSTQISSRISIFRSTDAPVRFRTLVTGLAGSALTVRGSIQAWPERIGGPLHGTVRLSVSLPQTLHRPSVFVFRLPDGSTRRLAIAPGSQRTIELPINVSGSWRASFDARGTQYNSEAGFGVAELTELRFDLTG